MAYLEHVCLAPSASSSASSGSAPAPPPPPPPPPHLCAALLECYLDTLGEVAAGLAMEPAPALADEAPGLLREYRARGHRML
jgi:hypothetical protein